jgi:hypothetical protein
MEENILKKQWYSGREYAAMKLPGIPHSESGFIRFANKTNMISRKRSGKGGGFEYSVYSLPSEALEAWSKLSVSEETESTNQKEIDVDATLYAQAPAYNRRRFDKYLWILQADQGLKGSELKDFIEDLQAKYPDRHIPSLATYYRLRNEYHQGGKTALLGNYGKRAGSSKTDPEQQEYFNSLYLSQSRLSEFKVWQQVVGKFYTPETINMVPAPRTFRRQLEKTVRKSKIYFARYGEKKWREKYGNFIDRDYSQVKGGQCLVSDHCQLDLFICNGKGKMVRPWITAWSDLKTSKILSIFMHEEPPNTDHILLAFRDAVLDWGLPEYILVDNGKDYRALDFAGGRYKLDVDEKKVSSLTSLLSVIAIFAIPFNAQAKPIERIFREFKEAFSKNIPTYCGGNIKERPEVLTQKLKSGDVMELETLTALFKDYVFNIYNKMPSHGKNLKGQSPNDAWNLEAPIKKVVSKDALKLFCMRTSRSVLIGRNGVKDRELDVFYWNDWMIEHKGRLVFMRRDIKDYREAWVFDAQTDEYIGSAQIRGSIPAIVQGEEAKQVLKAAMAEKQREVKINKEFQRNIYVPSVEERIQNQKRAAVLLNPDPVQESEQKVVMLANTPIDRIAAKVKKKQAASSGSADRTEKKVIRDKSHLMSIYSRFAEPPPLPTEEREEEQPSQADIKHRILDAFIPR